MTKKGTNKQYCSHATNILLNPSIARDCNVAKLLRRLRSSPCMTKMKPREGPQLSSELDGI